MKILAVLSLMFLAACNCSETRTPEQMQEYYRERCALTDMVMDPEPGRPWCRPMNMSECADKCKKMGQQYRSLENGSCKCWPSGVSINPKDVE